MKIVLYAIGLDHPDVATMQGALSAASIEFEATTDRPMGAIAAQPCVCALYDNGLVSQSWVLPLDLAAIQQSVGQDGSPATSNNPSILTKTEFQDYAVSQLGTGLTGMARFTEIMDATRDSTNGAVRFAWARYQAAGSFEKENTDVLTAVMADDDTTGHLTSDERTAILDNWPEH